MLIKRVAIQGFKTFARRTEFVFDPGVTAIVGPNGSGKSNVVDAIRWCLGEQSFSLLRSKKTSDVIFSGSDKKARLGMAQVSLFLDNSQGELPIDFAEVEITRRAYRDGDNEYLLNGRRVRLQDITELLAQTGLGKRTYALIGQGLIDRILSLAPEELRGLFEEAAGITGYQSKRVTTVRRLDAAHQNLTRVQDVIAEISPRLTYLKRQADRAREREQIAQDLRSLLMEWYGYHWHRTVEELRTRHAAVESLKQQVAQAQSALESTGVEIGKVRSQQAALRGEVGDLHHRSSELHRQAEALSKELAVTQERMRQIQARREGAQQELAPLRLQLDTLDARMAETQAEFVQWQTVQQERRAAVDALQGDVDTRQHERNRLAQNVSETRKALNQLQNEATDQRSRMRQLDERSAEIAQDMANQTTAQSVASQEAQDHTRRLADQETLHQRIQSEMAVLRGQLDEISTGIQSHRAALDEAQLHRQAGDRDVDRLQTRLDLLTRLHREGAGYASGVRAVIQAADSQSSQQRDSGLTGIVGAVASLIHVPAHLDKAIEIALGGAMQNIVTETWAATQAAIEWLKTNRHGRATFLPLDRLNVLPEIPAPRQPGILGNGAQLIDYDPAIGPAVEQLLNRVWVAEGLPAARSALDGMRGGPRPTVVTLEGEIIRPGGAVTGGSDRERRDDSILARERELRALPAQVEKAAQSAAQFANTCDKLAQDIETAGARIRPIQDELERLTRQESAARTALEATRREVDRAQQAVQWREQRTRELQTEAQELETQRAGLTQRLAQLESDIARHEEQLEAREEATAAAGADNLLQQMAELRAALAQAETTLQSKQALLENQRRNHESVQHQIQAKTQQIEDLGRDGAGLEAQLRILDGREQELNRAIAALQVELTPAETQLRQWEAQQASLEQQERTQQETLRRTESSYNTAQLQAQRTEDRIEQLQRQIEHDIGLVTLETADEQAYQPPLPWEAVVQNLPVVDAVSDTLEGEVQELRARLSRVSNVNPDAPREYAEAAGRHAHLLTQSEDLEAAIEDLRKVIRELDEVMETELTRTFGAVAEQFVHFFQSLFNGGSARLVLAEPDDIANSGIEIIARPPGKRPQSLALLSGGERTLTALALIFAILRVSPTPFCVLDEVDAALDEANVDRFRATLGELSEGTQFIVITHNRRTLEGTNAIYGITMASDGTSRVISLRLQGDRILRAPADAAATEGESTAGAGTATAGDDDQLGELEELVKM